MPHPCLQLVIQYTSCTHTDRSQTAVHVGLPVQPIKDGGLVTLTFDLLILKVVSESRVTWVYLCANFSLPLCSRLRPNECDRQTDVRQTDRQTDGRQTASPLNAPACIIKTLMFY